MISKLLTKTRLSKRIQNPDKIVRIYIPHCQNCEWWQIPDNVIIDFPIGISNVLYPLDDCNNGDVTQLPLAKICLSPKLSFFKVPQKGEATIIDGEQYQGNLVTNAEFGCINFEFKRRTNDIQTT